MIDSIGAKKTGGGENFISFLEKELIPYIDSSYSTQPYKMIIGHSLGGLMVVDILANHPKLFNAYISIDPSMWWDKERYLKSAQQKISANKYVNTRFYLAIANSLPDGMAFTKLQKDTTADTRHMRAIFALDKHMKANKLNGIKYSSKYYPEDSHTSVPLVSQYDGLRFIFDYYDLKLKPQDFADTAELLANKYQKTYARISEEFGYKVSPPERTINAFGHYFLSKKQFITSASLFKLNLINYPNSHFAYASYGDYYAARKDTSNAIINYEKALSISENPVVKQKLTGLQGKK
jgi:tetratricopeptide (TPR) repeat protein